jgi:hypothetical protein
MNVATVDCATTKAAKHSAWLAFFENLPDLKTVRSGIAANAANMRAWHTSAVLVRFCPRHSIAAVVQAH